MGILLLTLTLGLISVLTVARRIVEPPCPSCEGKAWNDQPARLQCTNCGWTNVTLAPVAVRSDAKIAA